MGLSLSKIQTTNHAQLCRIHLPTPLSQSVIKHQLDNGQLVASFLWHDTESISTVNIHVECYLDSYATSSDDQKTIVPEVVIIVVNRNNKQSEYIYRHGELVATKGKLPMQTFSLNDEDIPLVQDLFLYEVLSKEPYVISKLTLETEEKQKNAKTILLRHARRVLKDQTCFIVESLHSQLLQSPEIAIQGLKLLLEPYLFSPKLIKFLKDNHARIISPLVQHYWVAYLDQRYRQTCYDLRDSAKKNVSQLTTLLAYQFLIWLSFRNHHPSVEHYPQYVKKTFFVHSSIISIDNNQAQLTLSNFERAVFKNLQRFDLTLLTKADQVALTRLLLEQKVKEQLYLIANSIPEFNQEKALFALGKMTEFVVCAIEKTNQIFRGVSNSVHAQVWKFTPNETPTLSHYKSVNYATKIEFYNTIRKMDFTFSNLDDVYLSETLRKNDDSGLETLPRLCLQLILEHLNIQDWMRLTLCFNKRLREIVLNELRDSRMQLKSHIKNQLTTQYQFDNKLNICEYLRLQSIVIPENKKTAQLIRFMLNHLIRHAFFAINSEHRCDCAELYSLYIPIVLLVLQHLSKNDALKYIVDRPQFLKLQELFIPLFIQSETVKQFTQSGIPVSYFWKNNCDPFKAIQLLTAEEPRNSSTTSSNSTIINN